MLFNYKKTTLSLKKKKNIIFVFDRYKTQRHEEIISSDLICCPIPYC